MPEDKIIDEEEKPLCEKCGTILEMIDGELTCPKCSVEIDYFGEGDEERKEV